MSTAKTITRISPTRRAGLEGSERHYVAVHIPLARTILPQQESIKTYITARVRRQLDNARGWNKQPDAWRFIVLRFEGETVFPEEARRRLGSDHVNCLRLLRRTNVEERVLFDAVGAQSVFQGYLVELDRLPSTDAPSALRQAEELAATLVEASARVPGIRRVTFNTVLNETRVEPLEEEGQLLTPDYLPETQKVAYVEVVADDCWFGAQLFRQGVVSDALWSLSGFEVANCYELDERCGFDRRA